MSRNVRLAIDVSVATEDFTDEQLREHTCARSCSSGAIPRARIR